MVCSRGHLVLLPLATAFAILATIIIFLRYGSCPEGSFACDESYSLCVVQSLICDNKGDCPNREDEDLRVCRDMHGVFWELIKLWDNSSKNDVCELDERPQQCMCSDLTVLVCAGLELNFVPPNISNRTSKLILVNNQITLTNLSFNNLKLTLLNLANNSLVNLPAGVFKTQSFLKKIILDGNQLKIIPEELFFGLHDLEWLFLHNNQLKELNLKSWFMNNLTWLDLTGNKLKLSDEYFPKTLPSLSLLYLDRNEIEKITDKTFSNLDSVRDLKLNNNQLIGLDIRTFQMNLLLNKLDLSGNIDLKIQKELLSKLSNVYSLGLEDIDLYNIDYTMFTSLNKLQFVYFKRFKYCMQVPQVPICSPRSDGVSTAENLLADVILRTTLWFVAVFIILCNGLVLLHRLKGLKQSSPLNLIITNLAFSDLIMGVYLLLIGVVDSVYRGNYRQFASEWISSPLCTLAGIAALTSSEVGLLLLWLISLERFLLISTFFNGYYTLKPKAALATTFSIWSFVILLALLPVFVWRHAKRFYGTNNFCFPLHIDEPYAVGWHYTAFLFLGINSAVLLCIAIFYLAMFISIWRTRHATTLNVRDSQFALRFFCIVFANSCCWVPVIVLKILALCGFTFSKDVYGWIAIFVVPVNSAVNPVLHTFSTPGYLAGAQISGQAQIPNELQISGGKKLGGRCLSGMVNKSSTELRPRTVDEETQFSSRHRTSA
ncbi:follicle-stimulating hormone receptor-like isoform X3 [Rhodnius prolixus]|uniref:follicle-stimulating hormone receptor-like isoform X3 n=1 Tax=Rhodnius prolixus TaxID=13249 RepID=UPI003D18F0AD